MKYSEFKEKIEVWGRTYGYVARVGIDELYTEVRVESNEELYSIADVSNMHLFVINTDWGRFKEIEEHARKKLFNIIAKLAKTPIEDRKGE